MKLSPKTWSWSAGILGILLVICGFLSQQVSKPNTKQQCVANAYTWVPIVVGLLMMLMGFMCLLKGGKTSASSGMGGGGMGGGGMGGGGMGGGDPSISPEITPGGMM